MKPNLLDKILEAVSIIILLAATVFVLVNWSSLPEQIPSHYNFKGVPDAYGGSGSLVFTLVTGWSIVLLMWILSRFPALWNTGVERTPANEAVINRIVRDMIDVMETSMAAMFSYMVIVPVTGTNMGVWFVQVFLTVIFGTIIVTVVRLIRNR